MVFSSMPIINGNFKLTQIVPALRFLLSLEPRQRDEEVLWVGLERA